MAGSDPRFNPDRFRDAIKFAMQMGKPEAAQERVIFRWTPQHSYSVADPAGRPYDWTSTATASVTHDDVEIDCAVEFSARPAGTRDTPLGQFDTSRAVLTLLDVDRELVEGADLVVIDGNIYEIGFWGPPMGLFEVTVYQAFCEARDES